ncbi:MAG: hypothetical protein Q9188_002245 [Gyalolechia gomerana]
MSLKQEIETWVSALGHYDNNEFEEALKTFDGISDTSKILFNCGVIHATLGEHDKAIECYQRAIRLDNYLAVAYFQQGVSNFLVGDFEEALVNFNDTLLYLRGNTYINYEQLGLKFKLYSCEVLFNRGLCYIYLQQLQAGMGDLQYAAKEKVTLDHDVIDEAIREEAEGYTVFSIPVGVVYRPNSAKVKNLKTKDYLGKARLIAAADQGNTFTGFAGSEVRKASVPEVSRDDRPLESISFAASNLVKPGLTSRSRQHSAPPVNRNIFPPTPPPDHDQIKPTTIPTGTSPPPKPPAFTGRAHSVRNKPSRPERLDLNPSALNKELPRLGTVRTASEPRGPSRKHDSPRSKRDPPSSRGRLFMETTPLRSEDGMNANTNRFPDDLYDMYALRKPTRFSAERIPEEPNFDLNENNNLHTHRPNSRTRQSSRTRQHSRTRDRSQSRARHNNQLRYASDHDSDPATPSTASLSDFEILNNAGGTLSRPPPPSRSNTHTRERSSSRRRHSSRSRTQRQKIPELRTIRVKVHASSNDDTRYIMMNADSAFESFVDRVREKFGLRTRFKLKVRDEGDLITMGDSDDWTMTIEAVRRELEKSEGGGEMGKMEVCIDFPRVERGVHVG